MVVIVGASARLATMIAFVVAAMIAFLTVVCFRLIDYDVVISLMVS